MSCSPLTSRAWRWVALGLATLTATTALASIDRRLDPVAVPASGDNTLALRTLSRGAISVDVDAASLRARLDNRRSSGVTSSTLANGDGFVQSFLIPAAPGFGDSALPLVVDLATPMATTVEPGINGPTSFRLVTGRTSLRESSLAVTDANGADVEAHGMMMNDHMQVVVFDSGAVYPLHVRLDVGAPVAPGDNGFGPGFSDDAAAAPQAMSVGSEDRFGGLDRNLPTAAANCDVIAITAGFYHTLTVQRDNTVRSYGYNTYGQLGDGTTSNSGTPLTVGGLSGITAVAAGGYHSLARKNDGTVWAWGYNVYGQLGNGTTTNSSTPVQVSGLTNVVAIAGGAYHSLAVKSDGTVWAWGYNPYGQLGNGTTTNSSVPVQVSGISTALQVAAGAYHSVARLSNGTVNDWGYNVYGQLGNGTTTNSTTPVAATGVANAVSIGSGFYHTVAATSGGSALAWGYNPYGQLGNGTTNNALTFVTMTGIGNASKVAGGGYHSVILLASQTIMTTGYNTYGQLGNGNTTNSTVPITVPGLGSMTGIAAGSYHTVATKDDGIDKTAWGWGYNYYGQLGNGGGISVATPSDIINLTNQTKKTGGGYHSLALKSDGTLWAFGYNTYGQLGNGTTTDSSTPVQVSGLTGITDIGAGFYHSVARKSDGTVWAWGYNVYGQLGNGTTTNSSTPVQVSGLTNVVAVAGGGYHSLALKSDGTVWAWGYNTYGQLGNGTTTNSSTPVQVSGITTGAAIGGGAYHSLVALSDGTGRAFGYNVYGQLGDGTTNNASTPVTVSGLTNAIGMWGGAYHSVAVQNTGGMRTWGYNTYGQLGNGTTTNSSTPVAVSGISTALGSGAGYYHTVARLSDGTARAWGYNTYGQLGNGTTVNASTPVTVTGLSTVSAIGAGGYHSLASLSSGSGKGWGYNYYGQLGNGSSQTQLTPVSPNFGCGASGGGSAVGIPTISPTSGTTSTNNCGRVEVFSLNDTGSPRITYAWTITPTGGGTASPSSGSVQSSTSTAAAQFTSSLMRTCTAGTGNFTVTVTASNAFGPSQSKTITYVLSDNVPPVLTGVPPNATVQCTLVPAPAAVTATDNCGLAFGPNYNQVVTNGACPVKHVYTRTWSAGDCSGNTTNTTQVITEIDTLPPVVTPATGAIACLWPPDHRMIHFTLAQFNPNVYENCSLPITVKIVNVLSNQCDDAPCAQFPGQNGDGSTTGDAMLDADGQGVWLRSERAGTDPGGRVYTVQIVATDACGNATRPTSIGGVSVPHDQNVKSPIACTH